MLGGLAGSPVPELKAALADTGPSTEFPSCCALCQVRCTTKVEVRDGKVVNVFGNPENYWTGGAMCPKGKSLVELTYSPHRILNPLLRDGNGWKRIGYADAVQLIADRILEVKRSNPEDFAHRVALFMPLWESRESELAALMALRIAGFPDTCSPGETCIASTSAALRICLGTANSTTNMDEMMNSKILVLWGLNLAEIYPTYTRWLLAAKEKGVEIIYIDPRRTATSNLCSLQITPRPGSDGALALGIAHILIKEDLFDKEYVSARITGFEDLSQAVQEYTPQKSAEITRLPEEAIVQLARRLGASPRTLVWLGGSLARYTNGLQTIRNIVSLQAITNNLDGPGKGIMDVLGGKPGGEEEFLEHYTDPVMSPRLAFRKILYNMKNGKVDVLLLNSTYRRYPDANAVKEAISKVGLVVCRGFFMNEEAELAHVIIPGCMPFETSGSMYGSQRQVLWRSKIIEKPADVVDEFRFYTDLGKKVSPEKFPSFDTPEKLYEAFRKTIPSWKGLELERVKASNTGITWPSFSRDEPESKGSIFKDGKFPTPDGKVLLNSKPMGTIRWEEPEGSPLNPKSHEYGKFPLIFTQGKVVQHWHHSYTNWSSYMAQFSEGNVVHINPETARELDINDGDWSWIETKIGKLKAKVKLSMAILPDVIWTPSYPSPKSPFPGNQGVTINTIIPNYWDKVSAQFNGFGCRLVKAS